MNEKEKEQLANMIAKAVEMATAPILKRLEDAERQIERQATEIKILKQGGNL